MKSHENRSGIMLGAFMGLTGMLLASTVVLADGMGDMNGMSNMSSGADSAQASVGHGKGIIKSLDPKAGTVTITHGPIKEFGWSGMTMAFSVKQRSLLSSLKKGEHVQFDVIQDNGAAVITKISKLP